MKAGLMLGVNPSATRQKEDFYATNPKALELFLDKAKVDNLHIDHNVWECAAGRRHLADVLMNNGYCVKMSDLIKRTDGVEEIDFLNVNDKYVGDILTNPPFNLAEKFVEKGIELIDEGNKLFLFLKIQFLEGQARKKLFEKYPPKYVYCYSARQQCARDAEFEKYTATTQFYAWFVWEKSYKGDTIIKWI